MMITTHSGCDGTGMNTMEYLIYASSLKVDAIEIDIRRDIDGKLVLTHDPVGKNRLLSIETAFDFLKDKLIKINCDLKVTNLEFDVLKKAKEFGVQDRIILTGSITDPMKFRKQSHVAEVYINAEELIPNFYKMINDNEQVFRLMCSKCLEAGYNVVNLDYHVCDEIMIKQCSQMGLSLSLWTVDDDCAMGKMMEYSVVSNITTNHPQKAVCLRNAMWKTK